MGLTIKEIDAAKPSDKPYKLTETGGQKKLYSEGSSRTPRRSSQSVSRWD